MRNKDESIHANEFVLVKYTKCFETRQKVW